VIAKIIAMENALTAKTTRPLRSPTCWPDALTLANALKPKVEATQAEPQYRATPRAVAASEEGLTYSARDRAKVAVPM
jgi:hypothetical protein